MKSIKIGFASVLTMLLLSILIAVPVSAASPSIAVTSLQAYPAALMPGDTGTITVTLMNTPASMGSTTTTNSNTYNYGAGVSNGLTTPSHSEVQSVANTNTPNGAYVLKQVQLLADAPLYVTSGEYDDIGSLGVSDSATFTFTFRVENGTPDGIYKMILKVRTDDGNVYLNYPVKVQVESDEPQLTFSDLAKAYNSSDDDMLSVDVFNPRDTPIQAVTIRASGDDFSIAPQNSFIGTLNAGATYSSDFTVKSKEYTYDTMPQFVLVYRNGENWHQTAPIVAYTQPPEEDWWSAMTQGLAANWLVYFVAGAVCALVLALLGAFVMRKPKN